MEDGHRNVWNCIPVNCCLMKESKDLPKIGSSFSRVGEGQVPPLGPFQSILVAHLGSYPAVRLAGGRFRHAAPKQPTVKFAGSANLSTH